jgi:hypothetical protein
MRNQRKFRPNLIERLGVQWCRMMHDSAMWPMRGRYQCRACGRSYLVPWDGEPANPVPLPIRQEPLAARRAA